MHLLYKWFLKVHFSNAAGRFHFETFEKHSHGGCGWRAALGNLKSFSPGRTCLQKLLGISGLGQSEKLLIMKKSLPLYWNVRQYLHVLIALFCLERTLYFGSLPISKYCHLRRTLLLGSVTCITSKASLAPTQHLARSSGCNWRTQILFSYKNYGGKLAEPEVLTASFCSSKHEDGALIGISMTLSTVVSEHLLIFRALPALLSISNLSFGTICSSPVSDQTKNNTKTQLRWEIIYSRWFQHSPVHTAALAAYLLGCTQCCPLSPGPAHTFLSHQKKEEN